MAAGPGPLPTQFVDITPTKRDTLFTMSENVYYQFRAMETMRERLQESLSEDQFAEIDNFFRFAENALNTQLPKEEQAQ